MSVFKRISFIAFTTIVFSADLFATHPEQELQDAVNKANKEITFKIKQIEAEIENLKKRRTELTKKMSLEKFPSVTDLSYICFRIAELAEAYSLNKNEKRELKEFGLPGEIDFIPTAGRPKPKRKLISPSAKMVALDAVHAKINELKQYKNRLCKLTEQYPDLKTVINGIIYDSGFTEYLDDLESVPHKMRSDKKFYYNFFCSMSYGIPVSPNSIPDIIKKVPPKSYMEILTREENWKSLILEGIINAFMNRYNLTLPEVQETFFKVYEDANIALYDFDEYDENQFFLARKMVGVYETLIKIDRHELSKLKYVGLLERATKYLHPSEEADGDQIIAMGIYKESTKSVITVIKTFFLTRTPYPIRTLISDGKFLERMICFIDLANSLYAKLKEKTHPQIIRHLKRDADFFTITDYTQYIFAHKEFPLTVRVKDMLDKRYSINLLAKSPWNNGVLNIKRIHERSNEIAKYVLTEESEFVIPPNKSTGNWSIFCKSYLDRAHFSPKGYNWTRRYLQY